MRLVAEHSSAQMSYDRALTPTNMVLGRMSPYSSKSSLARPTEDTDDLESLVRELDGAE